MSVLKNTGYNVAGTIVPVLVSLATVPLYLHTVGTERFGVLSLCWLILGYFAIFDLGLGRAISQRIAALPQDADEERNRVFWAGLLISGGVAIIGTALVMPFAQTAIGWLRFDTPELRNEIGGAAPWLAAMLPLTLMTTILTGGLIGRERFAAINAIEGASNSLTMIAPLLVAWWLGPQLAHLIAACFFARLLAALMFAKVCRSAIPVRAPTLPDRALSRSLLGYGGWVSVTGTVGPILSLWDRFAVGAILGTAAVSIYVIPFTLVLRLIMIPAALTRALFPRLAGADPAQARQLAIDGSSGLALFMTPCVLGFAIVLKPFLDLWIGKTMGAESTTVGLILLPGIWLNGFALIALTFLHARERPEVAGRLHLAEVLPYIGLLYLAMVHFGLIGTAAVWTLRTVIDAIGMFGLSAVGLAPIKRLLPSAGLVVAACIAALLLPYTAPAYWLVLIALLAIGAWESYRIAPETIKMHSRSAMALVLAKLGARKADTEK